MPIKDWSKYPKNWKTEIRPAILERDGNCCKFCGVPNYAVGERVNDKFVPTCGNYHHDKAGRGELNYAEAVSLANHCNEIEGEKSLIVIVLTIMHLDHDTTNNDYSNLAAGCQKCHLNYDKEHHAKNSSQTRLKKKKQIPLF